MKSETATVQNDQETKGFLCVCKDCEWTDAFDAVSAEEAMFNDEDPAQTHHHETGHKCASVPVGEFDASELRGLIFNDE